MLLRTPLKCEHSLMPAATRVWAAHLTEELTYLLHATVRLLRNPHVDVSKETVLAQKTNRKEIISTAGRERMREEGGTTGSKKQRPSCKMLRAPSNSDMLFSNSCKLRAICRRWSQKVARTQFTDFSRTGCKRHVNMWNEQTIIPTCCKYHSAGSFELQQAAKKHPNYRSQFQNAAHAMLFASDSYNNIQTPCDAMHFALVCCIYYVIVFWLRNAASILRCTAFLILKGQKQRSFGIWLQIV